MVDSIPLCGAFSSRVPSMCCGTELMALLKFCSSPSRSWVQYSSSVEILREGQDRDSLEIA